MCTHLSNFHLLVTSILRPQSVHYNDNNTMPGRCIHGGGGESCDLVVVSTGQHQQASALYKEQFANVMHNHSYNTMYAQASLHTNMSVTAIVVLSLSVLCEF